MCHGRSEEATASTRPKPRGNVAIISVCRAWQPQHLGDRAPARRCVTRRRPRRAGSTGNRFPSRRKATFSPPGTPTHDRATAADLRRSCGARRSAVTGRSGVVLDGADDRRRLRRRRDARYRPPTGTRCGDAPLVAATTVATGDGSVFVPTADGARRARRRLRRRTLARDVRRTGGAADLARGLAADRRRRPRSMRFAPTDGTSALGPRRCRAPTCDAPAIDGDRVFVPVADDRSTAIATIDLPSHAIAWTSRSRHAPDPLLAANGRLYFGGEYGSVYAYGQDDGRRMVDRCARAGVSIGRAAADAKHVYVALRNKTVARARRQQRQPTMEAPSCRPGRARRSVAGAEQVLVCRCDSGEIAIWPARQGRPRAISPFPARRMRRPTSSPRLEDAAASTDVSAGCFGDHVPRSRRR